MKANHRLEIQVYADWANPQKPMVMGTLSSQVVRGKEMFSFQYHQDWLESKHVQILDPALQLFKGEQFNNSEKSNFGIFLDSSPDRWGRILQKRRAAIQARAEGKKESTLMESDFLLGVHDKHRLGGLRFCLKLGGPFLDDSETWSSPPITSLRELEAAAWALENNHPSDDPDFEKWVRMLIVPGGSLGGARPKASVLSENHELWIAKFPSHDDKQDTGAWELVVHQLAKKAGIQVPEAYARVFRGPQHTFLSKRFDRVRHDDHNGRIHFASAMTMLNKNDGADAHDGTSYLDLAEFLMKSGANPDKDLEQLWRRIVFNICVSNTDDHLRNHGFLLTQKGWILSPAYDMNPNPDGTGLKLNISENDNSQDIQLALDVAAIFRVKKSEADAIVADVLNAVKQWQSVATAQKISRQNQNDMAAAFRRVE